MTDDKVYKPEEILDTLLPLQGEVSLAESQSTTNQVHTAKIVKDQSIPRKIVAHETIGSALNTKSRKILAEFQFTESGSLQIGKYENGISGDIRITPNGITARDQAGNTTFTLDGDTGDAVFKGTIQTGTLISGAIVSGDFLVGGKNNSSGILTVLDSSDGQIMTLSSNGINIFNGSYLSFSPGTEGALIGYDEGLGKLRIIALDHDFFLETDSGKTTIYSEGGIDLTISNNVASGKLKIYKSGSTQIAELDSSGNLLISGTLTQSHTF